MSSEPDLDKWRTMTVRFRETIDYGAGPMDTAPHVRVRVTSGWMIIDRGAGAWKLSYIPSDLVVSAYET